MKVKTAIVEKSLYDVINENLSFIISLITNIFILNYNHYTLIYMNNITNSKFETYSDYIQMCQYITLLSLFLSLYCKNANSKFPALITLWAIIIKSIVAVYTYGNLFSFLTLSKEIQGLLDDMNNTNNINNDLCQLIVVFNTIFITIVNIFMFVISLMILLAYIMILVNNIMDWCKSFKIKYKSQQVVMNEEEV